MGVKTKRTYNLSQETVERVRELAERSGIAPTQDGIVETAVERLYLEVRAEQEADLWATAREDQDSALRGGRSRATSDTSRLGRSERSAAALGGVGTLVKRRTA
jgi:hypothetical protein